MREVTRDEARAICEAGGEVMDGDGDVWSVFGSVMYDIGPFRVSKEPPPQWKRGVPDSPGVYWCRVDDSDHEPTLVKLPESGGVYDFGCEENIYESVVDFEFCPLREKAPE